MPINAGDVRSTMTLDLSGFEENVAKARAELSTLDESGQKTTASFEQLEAKTSSSAAAMARAMESAGKGGAQLTELAARADQSAAKVDALSQRTAEAAQQLSAAKLAAVQSGNALKLLEESAAASAENLARAEQALEELKNTGSATQTELIRARQSVRDFAEETADLSKRIQQQSAAHEANSGTLLKAEARYRQLAAQLLGAEAAADKANMKFSVLTETLSSGPLSIKGITETVSQLGTSTLTSAARSMGTIITNAAGVSTTTAAGALASNGLSEAMLALVKTLGVTKLGLIGVGAGAIYAGVKLYQATREAENGVESWEKLYEGIDTERTRTFTTIVNSEFKLQTDGLDEKVKSVYDEIAKALTDGKPDTAAVVSQIEGSAQGMFSTVRAKLQEWYDAEMANLDLSTPAGLQKAAELGEEYETLLGRVEQLDSSTSAWITEYAGKSTEACTAALSQLETYEEELERLAKRADEMTALLQSNQRAAYTAVSNGLTADTTTVANAVQYVQFDYSTNLQYAEDDYNAQMAELWQEYQDKLQLAANEQERLQINAEYSLKLEQENSAYSGTKNQLAAEYNRMMGDVMQGAAESLIRSDPALGAAIQQAIAGDYDSLSDLKLDNTQLAEIMKGFVESGVLDGITNADLTTPEGQIAAMVRLLAQGTQAAVEATFEGVTCNKNAGMLSFMGVVESDFADAIDRITAQGVLTPAKLEDFFDAMDYSYDRSPGTEHLAGFLDAVSTAASSGNLDAAGLEKYGAVMEDLFVILDTAEGSGTQKSVAFLNDLSGAMNALGYDTDTTTVVDTLHQLWDAYAQLESLQPDVEVAPELTFNENGIPTPSLEWLEANGYYQQPESQMIEIPVEPMISSSSLVIAEAEGSGLADSAAGGTAEAEGLFASAGDNAGAAFVSGMRDHLGDAAAAGTAIGSAAYNALKESLDIHSPSRKMRALGRNTGSGYALGIEDEITLAEASVQRLAGSTMKAAADVTNNNYNNSVNVTLPNASIRSEDDARYLSRQIGRVVQRANYGVT